MAFLSANAPRTRTRAVVCDDSPFMRRLLCDALGACGVEVVGQAANGADALAACAKLRPDVMTLDLQMPGISGMEVLRKLPAGGPGVIVVSAYTDEGSALAVEALSIGAAEVIRKPGADTPLARFAADLGASVQAAAASRRGSRLAPTLRRAPEPQAPARREAAFPPRPDRAAPPRVAAPPAPGPDAVVIQNEILALFHQTSAIAATNGFTQGERTSLSRNCLGRSPQSAVAMTRQRSAISRRSSTKFGRSSNRAGSLRQTPRR